MGKSPAQKLWTRFRMALFLAAGAALRPALGELRAASNDQNGMQLDDDDNMQVESQGAADDDNMQVENQGAAVVSVLCGQRTHTV